MMITKQGTVKKTPLSEYSNPRAGGIIAINLEDSDELMGVKMTDGSQEIIIGTRDGLAIHFKEEEVRPIGRVGKGVRGIELRKEDQVVGMEVVKKEEIILVATENGYGKKTKVKEYRIQSRGGKGVINIKANERNGRVISIKRVSDNDDIMVITQKGVVNRQPVKAISTMGRNTQGVRLIKLQEGDRLVSVARMIHESEVPKDEQDDKKV
jgi:DNA gyrase subunit A